MSYLPAANADLRCSHAGVIETLLNLLHITPYYAPAYAFGGVVRAVEGMATTLAKRGHNVTVLTTDALTQTERYTGALDTIENGVRIVRIRNLSVWLRGRANLSTPMGIRKVAGELIAWADIIHCHEFRTLENLLITPIAAQKHKPLVLSPHGTLTTSTGRGALKLWWDRLLSFAVARRFHTVIGLTTAELNDVQSLRAQFGAHAEFAIVPNGVDPDAFTQIKGGAAFRTQWGDRRGRKSGIVSWAVAPAQRRRCTDRGVQSRERSNQSPCHRGTGRRNAANHHADAGRTHHRHGLSGQ